MAVESLEQGRFTVASDVVSRGTAPIAQIPPCTNRRDTMNYYYLSPNIETNSPLIRDEFPPV